jgi:hypothetical protein
MLEYSLQEFLTFTTNMTLLRKIEEKNENNKYERDC